jgi:3-oxoacyl-[acyl-carrier protein] reductase
MDRFQGQVALITGSTRGLGRETALALTAERATVVVNSRHQADCDQLVAETQAAGGNALGLAADLRVLDQARTLVETAISELGRLDILINNAGYFEGADSFWRHSQEQVVEAINLNFAQVFIASQVAARQMIQQGSGCILNVSTGGATLAHRDRAVYDAAKGAVESLTRCMAAELAPHGVRVNCIAPGALSTWPDDLDDTAKNRARLAIIPQGRFGTAQDFANLALFLCSPESDYITGQVITLDGGRGCFLPVKEIQEREYALEGKEGMS